MRKKSIVAGLLLGGATLVSVAAASADNERYFEIAKNLDIFATLFKEVNTYYVDEVPPAKLVKTGIDAMLKSLQTILNGGHSALDPPRHDLKLHLLEGDHGHHSRSHCLSVIISSLEKNIWQEFCLQM